MELLLAGTLLHKSYAGSLIKVVALRNMFAFVGFIALMMLVGPVHSAENAEASYRMGVNAFQQNDFKAAFEAWHFAAEQGVADAQYNLGVLYLEGRGVEKDFVRARFWLLKAALSNHAKAQYNLGHIFLAGLGTDKNLNTAVKWWHRSAQSGYLQAQFNYGRALYIGLGGNKDIAAGLKMIELAAQGNDDHAKNFLSKNAEEIKQFRQAEANDSISKPKVPAELKTRMPKLGTDNSELKAKNSVTTKTTGLQKPSLPLSQRSSKTLALDDNQWLFAQAKAAYFIRVFTVLNHARAVQLVQSEPFKRNGQLFTNRNQKQHWTYLLLGPYANKSSAKAARHALPSEYVKDARVHAIVFITKNRCTERNTLKPDEAQGLEQLCK